MKIKIQNRGDWDARAMQVECDQEMFEELFKSNRNVQFDMVEEYTGFYRHYIILAGQLFSVIIHKPIDHKYPFPKSEVVLE